ncbi:hypothetical protein [Limnohabitans sp.]|uniref:hypothetical protein n=1 Tax=Limnohabitans sp. TaxID=1907725 RepID=UPI0037C11BFA
MIFLLDQVEISTERERLVPVGLHKAIHGAELNLNTMNAEKPHPPWPEGNEACGLL